MSLCDTYDDVENDIDGNNAENPITNNILIWLAKHQTRDEVGTKKTWIELFFLNHPATLMKQLKIQ